MTRELDDKVAAYWEAMLQELSHQTKSLSVVSERLSNGVKDHVLYAGSVTLADNGTGTVGVRAFQWEATCGSIEVHNTTTHNVVVTSSTVQANPPTFGQGVHHVKANVWRLCNIGSRFLTIYGTIGDVIEVQALTTGGVYGGGVLL